MESGTFITEKITVIMQLVIFMAVNAMPDQIYGPILSRMDPILCLPQEREDALIYDKQSRSELSPQFQQLVRAAKDVMRRDSQLCMVVIYLINVHLFEDVNMRIPEVMYRKVMHECHRMGIDTANLTRCLERVNMFAKSTVIWRAVRQWCDTEQSPFRSLQGRFALDSLLPIEPMLVCTQEEAVYALTSFGPSFEDEHQYDIEDALWKIMRCESPNQQSSDMTVAHFEPCFDCERAFMKDPFTTKPCKFCNTKMYCTVVRMVGGDHTEFQPGKELDVISRTIYQLTNKRVAFSQARFDTCLNQSVYCCFRDSLLALSLQTETDQHVAHFHLPKESENDLKQQQIIQLTQMMDKLNVNAGVSGMLAKLHDKYKERVDEEKENALERTRKQVEEASAAFSDDVERNTMLRGLNQKVFKRLRLQFVQREDGVGGAILISVAKSIIDTMCKSRLISAIRASFEHEDTPTEKWVTYSTHRNLPFVAHTMSVGPNPSRRNAYRSTNFASENQQMFLKRPNESVRHAFAKEPINIASGNPDDCASDERIRAIGFTKEQIEELAVVTPKQMREHRKKAVEQYNTSYQRYFV